MIQRLIRVTLIFFFIAIWSVSLYSKNKNKYKFDLNHHEIRERLELIFEDMKVGYHKSVRQHIRYYIERKRDGVEGMLGRAYTYIPIFEHYLEVNELPAPLKYLPVIESALNPRIESRAGAKGLWQFMPRTGRSYGLEIDSYVDERCDPHKSTEAAMAFLKKQYKRFGSWPLALAAYNCGSGTVRKAIRKAGTKNYWKLRRHLPKETRNYVPAFIAACYVMNYYQFHDLNPKYPDYNIQMTETVKVFQVLTFKQISQATGVDMATLEVLNPSYFAKVIPRRKEGNYLVLPQDVVAGMDDGFYYSELVGINFARENIEELIPSDSTRTTYQVKSGDKIEVLANRFQCSPENIQSWNGLKSPQLHFGQKLTFYVPQDSDIMQ